MDGQVAMERLRYLRDLKGLSQTKLAKDANLGPATIQRLETQPTAWERVSENTLGRLCRALDISKDYFSSEDEIDLDKQPSKTTKTTHSHMAHPIKSDIDAVPRMGHVKEDWNEQGLCLMEHVRQVYWDWANGREQSLDTLLDAIDETVILWGDNHGFENTSQPLEPSNGADDDDDDVHHDDTDDDDGVTQIIKPDDILYGVAEDEFGISFWIEKLGAAKDYIAPGSSIRTTRVVKENGKRYDIICVTNGKSKSYFYIACNHQTTSRKAEDHPVALSSSFSRSKANGTGTVIN